VAEGYGASRLRVVLGGGRGARPLRERRLRATGDRDDDGDQACGDRRHETEAREPQYLMAAPGRISENRPRLHGTRL
jgi:hypothetical protein